MSFSLNETKDILKVPAVIAAMRAIVAEGTLVKALPRLRPWSFAGKEHPTLPFQHLRATVEAAITRAIQAVEGKGKDKERLYLMLRMAPGDSVEAAAKAVAETTESYAVVMLHGSTGLQSYRAHVSSPTCFFPPHTI